MNINNMYAYYLTQCYFTQSQPKKKPENKNTKYVVNIKSTNKIDVKV